MATIVTRAGKGSALTHNEVDANFNNLNNDKIEAAQSVTLTNKTISGSNNTLSNIGNSSLTNSSVTIGSTSVSLGSTATTVSGLTLSSPTVNTPTLSGGTINNASVGATTPSSGAFTTLSATGVTTVQAGTVSAPAITTSGDTNTGIYFPAADTIAFTEGGVESMRIDSSGQVGIGTQSPGATLDVSVALPSMQINATTGTNRVWLRTGNTGGDFYFGRENSAGNSFGVTAYSSVLWSQGAYPMVFATNGTERMRIDSSGNLGLGVTPSAWGTSKALQIGQAAIWNYNGTNNIYAGANYYFDGSTRKRIASGYAGEYLINGSDQYIHSWYVAGTSTAGSTVSFTQAMTLDASGNLGVGTTSPGGKLDVRAGTGATLLVAADATNLVSINNYNSTSGFQDFKYAGSTHQFFTGTAGGGSVSERARITSGGSFLVNNTTDDQWFTTTNAGFTLNSSNFIAVARSGGAPIIANRLTSDGDVIEIRQAGTTEGTISVSGTTVSYNGGHLARYSQLLSGQRDESIVKGTVLSNLDEMCEWLDAEGNPLPNEQLNRTKVSDVEGDTNVAGVFVNWDNDDQDNPYDMNIAMTGDMIIRIAQGVTVQKGDLLMSAGDGTAKPQGDDIVRSKTVAKVTSNHVTCTYEDGSYCVPCVLMAC